MSRNRVNTHERFDVITSGEGRDKRYHSQSSLSYLDYPIGCTRYNRMSFGNFNEFVDRVREIHDTTVEQLGGKHTVDFVSQNWSTDENKVSISMDEMQRLYTELDDLVWKPQD
jgi:hypothetical protein